MSDSPCLDTLKLLLLNHLMGFPSLCLRSWRCLSVKHYPSTWKVQVQERLERFCWGAVWIPGFSAGLWFPTVSRDQVSVLPDHGWRSEVSFTAITPRKLVTSQFRMTSGLFISIKIQEKKKECFPFQLSRNISILNVFSAGVRVKLEDETDCGMVGCADDPEVLNKLSWASEKGQSPDWIHAFFLWKIDCVSYFMHFQTWQYLFGYSHILCCSFESPVCNLLFPVQSFYPDKCRLLDVWHQVSHSVLNLPSLNSASSLALSCPFIYLVLVRIFGLNLLFFLSYWWLMPV